MKANDSNLNDIIIDSNIQYYGLVLKKKCEFITFFGEMEPYAQRINTGRCMDIVWSQRSVVT